MTFLKPEYFSLSTEYIRVYGENILKRCESFQNEAFFLIPPSKNIITPLGEIIEKIYSPVLPGIVTIL